MFSVNHPSRILSACFVGLCLGIAIQNPAYAQETTELENSDPKPDRLSTLLPALSEEEKAIRDELIAIRKSMEARGKRVNDGRPILSRDEFTRIRKLEKLAESDEDKQVIRFWLVGDFDLDNPPDEPIWEIEEVLVIGRQFSFEHLPEDPIEFSVSEIREMRGIRRVANQLYGEGDYEKAYPILLELAKRGFKDSQSRLAYILFNGVGEVKKSNLRAMGWLGAAAHGRTEPAFKVLFKKYNRQIPKESRDIVDRVVAGYRERFSHSEHLDCSTNHQYASGIVKKVYCRFKLEAIAEACKGQCWAYDVNVQPDKD